MRYVEAILPVPLHQLFTYSVPEELEPLVVPGARLYVPFGRSVRYTAVAVRLTDQAPQGYQVKPILQVLDEQGPSLLSGQMRLLFWLSDYYMCAPGDVLKTMLPGALRPEGGDSSERFKPHTETYVRLKVQDAAQTIESLNRYPRQQELIRAYLTLSGSDLDPQSPLPVSKRALLGAGGSPSTFRTLTDKGILETYRYEVGRLPQWDGVTVQPNSLNEEQHNVLLKLKRQFRERHVSLLHGVTASGKTEVYIHLIREELAAGRQVLFLLPEIALTLTMLQRLQRVFGSDMGVYHSRCSQPVRAETWRKQLSDHPYGLMVGARSAVMLPFRNLGLVIVDEEHDTSYKQEEPAPRYSGRDTAIMLASFFGAKVLLGSATPSIESYYLAQTGKYGFASLPHRYYGAALPKIETVDISELRHKKLMRGLLSPRLKELVAQTLARGEQVVLFQNRRGYAPIYQCPACGWVPRCDNCDVSLTYHRQQHRLICHYCGNTYPLPAACPQCGSVSFRPTGFGTEKIQEEVESLFPGTGVLRLDLDTAGTVARYEQIMQDFQDGIAGILIGTQMVTKGLDFDRVSLVGIISADAMLSQPDFRAAEHAFQIMSQVAGRAGRRQSRGTVVIQARGTDHPVYSFVRRHDYVSFYNHELAGRNTFCYPPFSRIIIVYLRSKDPARADEAAFSLAADMRQHFDTRVLGPDAPPVARVQTMHIRNIMLKTERGTAMGDVRRLLLAAADRCMQQFRSVQIYFDVDPL